MSLQIKNIKTDKNEYIYPEDKKINISFDIFSDDKSYNINSIFINYWIEFTINWKKRNFIFEKFLVTENTLLNKWDSQKNIFSLPIKYPDVENYNLKFKNYIEVVTNIKFITPNPYKKIYLKINSNFSNWKLNKEQNEQDMIDILFEKIDILDEKLDNLRVITDENNFDKIEDKILQLIQNGNEEEISKLEQELKKYFVIKDENKFNKLKIERDKVYDELEKYENLEKVNKNYIRLNDSNSNILIISKKNYFENDYIDKNFHDYLLHKYSLYKIYLLLFNYYHQIFFWLSFIVVLYSIFYFKDYFLYDYYSLWFVIIINIVFFWIIYYIFTDFFKNLILNKIKNDILQIKFKNKNKIKQSFINKNLNIEDFFEELNINYDWNYTCNFNLILSCDLIINIQEWSWRDTKMVKYGTSFFSLKLAEYQWNNLNLTNLKIYDFLEQLEKNYIEPGYLFKPKFLSPNSVKVVYKISYDFTSPEIIDKSWEFIIT